MATISPSPSRVDTSLWEESSQRILASQCFNRCPRLRAFLAYVVQCAAEDRLHEVNEYSLGVTVFGRPQSFSPSEDNIVRVTARQLRVKLEEYYHGEGADDPWRIEVPKGGYVPQLVPHGPAPHMERTAPVPDTLSGLSRRARQLGSRFPLLAVLLTLVGLSGWGVAAWLLSQTPASTPPATRSAYAIEGLFADPAIPITLIMEDPLLPAIRHATGRTPNLDQFLTGAYLDSAAYPENVRSTLLPMIVGGDLIRPDVALLFGELKAIASGRGTQVQAVQARNFTPRQLGLGSLVIVGGVGSNPWVNAMQDHIAFVHEINEELRMRRFVNRKPLPGEPHAFATDENGDGPRKFYTRVAVFANPHGRGKVALLGGTSQQSTAGAYRFALSQEGVREIESRCGNSVAKLPYFEAILETKAIGKTPTRWSVKAIRCSAPVL